MKKILIVLAVLMGMGCSVSYASIFNENFSVKLTQNQINTFVKKYNK